ncbi:hypothetical protein ACIQZO_37395 [Streptomyces sp. NPDC097617]|uniref:hypothetical protein n=1 Tax=Streptomyces sp. NPDC097617 TaxID=3366091 RepID=UPI0038122EC5
MNSQERFSADLKALLLELCEQMGGSPTLSEFLEILEWSSDDIYSGPLKFEAVLADRIVTSESNQTRVPELSDSIFSDVASALSVLVNGSGSHVTPQELASILLIFVNDQEGNLLDVTRGDVASLSVMLAGSVVEVAVGDVLGIPAADGSWYAAVVVARNRFGLALGLFRTRFEMCPSMHSEGLAPHGFPIYTDDAMVSNGSWEVIGHGDARVAQFPPEPEIYHSPGFWPGVDAGEFGAAESPSGGIRLIGSEEACAVGLADGTYQHSYMSEFLGQSLGALMDR